VGTFIIRRLFLAVIIILLVTIIVFLAMRLLPGDPILMLVTASEAESSTQEQMAVLKKEFGLDKPLVIQYFNWLGGVCHGDLGKSILQHAPVGKEIIRRLPITLHLGLLALALSIIIGVPAGVVCAVRRGSWLDTIVTFLTNLGITIPNFWLGIILIYLFAVNLNWLPVQGYTSPFTDFAKNTRQIIMPVFCLCVFPIASAARQTRSSMLEVMHQDYIRTAWSKGIDEKLIILRHGLKNALIPVVTLMGMSFSMIIGGAVIIETVFNIPGMGRLAVASVLNQDYPYVQGITLIIAIMVVLSNLLVDIIISWLDPRIHYD
jgi:peptide/nickel transport system permease protein